MIRKIIIATLAVLYTPTLAMGAGVPVVEPGQKPTFTCQPVHGNAVLERAQRNNTPPPEPPIGAPHPPEVLSAYSQTPAGTGTPCAPGTIGVSTSKPLLKRRHPIPLGVGAHAAATSYPANGYTYVGDVWLEPKVAAQAFAVEFSAPVIPLATADNSGHSVAQLATVGGPKESDTIETGWSKTYTNQQEGYGGPEVFFELGIENYNAERSCDNCHLILAAGQTSPYGSHFYATDNSSASKCEEPPAGSGVFTSPCELMVGYEAKQYRGAWWLAWNYKWIGSVSDLEWSPTHSTKPFTKGKDEQVYGEVYEHPAGSAPVMPMGNGNHGSCTCATKMDSPAIEIVTKEGRKEKNLAYHNPLENEPTPQWYSSGNFTNVDGGSGRYVMHFGGS